MAYQPKLDPGAMLEGYLGINATNKGLVDGYITSNSPRPEDKQKSK